MIAAASRSPGPGGNLVEAALALRSLGRLEEALEMVSGLKEFSADGQILRADLQIDLGRIQDAVSSYSTVLAFEGHHVYAQYNLAKCLCRLGRWEAAAEAFRKVLISDPHRDDARIGLGDSLLQLNRAEEALSCFNACWSEVFHVRALFGKAVALQLLGRLDEAAVAYERLLALDPSAEEAFANLIALSVERLDMDAVHRYSLRLLELSPQSAIALQGLTVAALEREEYEMAAGYFQHLAMAPDECLPEQADRRGTIQYRPNPAALARLVDLQPKAERIAVDAR